MVTADIPLAATLVEHAGVALDHCGEVFTEDNVRERAHRGRMARAGTAPVQMAAVGIFLFAVAASAVLDGGDRSVYRFLFGDLNPGRRC